MVAWYSLIVNVSVLCQKRCNFIADAGESLGSDITATPSYHIDQQHHMDQPEVTQAARIFEGYPPYSTVGV